MYQRFPGSVRTLALRDDSRGGWTRRKSRWQCIAMVDRVDVLWHCSALHSAEHFSLQRTDDHWTLVGKVSLLVDGIPGHISYIVTASADWVTDRTLIDVAVGGRQQGFVIVHVDGEWTVNGQARPDLAGCTDVDLGWTPATNTIPLRRLAVDVGEQAEIRAAWVRFPELDIQANEQRYVRLAPNTWRYQSGLYDFVLAVSEDGLVLEYGDDLWRAVGVVREAV
jgi:uncharacterized protein